jgi:hypothetical protein
MFYFWMGTCSQAHRAAAAALAISARRSEVSFAARARPPLRRRTSPASAGAHIAAFVAVSVSASNCRIRCSASVRISSLCRSASAFFAWRAYLPTGSRSRECPRRRRSGEPQGSLASMGRRPRRTSPRSHRARRRRFLQAWLSSKNRDWQDGSAKACANIPVNGLLGACARIANILQTVRKLGLMIHESRAPH